MSNDYFVFQDESEVWLKDIMDNRYEEALARANSLLRQTTPDANGCWVRPTKKRPKLRFRGWQVAAARFVYCVVNREVLSQRIVIRHRCHNERCCRPEHLQTGSAADNKRDDWDYWANGVNYDLL
ncbi:HNH endonuclease [Sulfitobacter mediterraneus]|uniref:HNH endonuclease n=1 Tax=Sulfitobacter mediterraneus TaxID=83219 RepID=UPI0021A911EB|nr:HNH endonuclease [Sulfitobacter mediterraneus]UWR10630.1 HNH endonuclease [Sulfitobacter mediterraneus]